MEDKFKKSEFFELESQDRINALETNATRIKEGFTYSKHLTEFQIKEFNDDLNQALNEIANLKDKRKDLNTLIKDQEKIVTLNNQMIIMGYEEVTERVYTINNHHTGFAEVINEDGFIIERHRFKEGTEMSIFENNNKKAV